MIKLMLKELRLAIPRTMYFFLIFSLMVLIPSYPAIVGAGYIFLAIFIMFTTMRDNRDYDFTLMLPTKLKLIVKSKIFDVVLLELLTFASLIISVVISYFLYPQGNIVGIDSNLAYLGIVLIIYAVFNAVFLPLYFRNIHKHGLPCIIAVVCALIIYLAIELTIQTTALSRYIDSPKLSTFGYQSIVLAIGVIVFIIGTVVNSKVCVKIFNRKHG